MEGTGGEEVEDLGTGVVAEVAAEEATMGHPQDHTLKRIMMETLKWIMKLQRSLIDCKLYDIEFVFT